MTTEIFKRPCAHGFYDAHKESHPGAKGYLVVRCDGGEEVELMYRPCQVAGCDCGGNWVEVSDE